MPSDDRTAAPQGFRPLPPHDAAIYNTLVGPFWVRPEAQTVAFGFRVELRHCNPMRLCHGGMLAGFADIVLTGGCNHVARLSRFLTTVSLTTDFLAPAAMGAWVEARPEVLAVTRSTLFGQCLVTRRLACRCCGPAAPSASAASRTRASTGCGGCWRRTLSGAALAAPQHPPDIAILNPVGRA